MWMLEVWLVVSKIICVTKLHFTFSRWQCPMDCSCICRKCMIIYKECVDLKSHIFLLSLSKSPHIMMQLFLSKACIKWSQWMPVMLYLDVLHVYNVTSELLFGINFVTPSVNTSQIKYGSVLLNSHERVRWAVCLGVLSLYQRMYLYVTSIYPNVADNHHRDKLM